MDGVHYSPLAGWPYSRTHAESAWTQATAASLGIARGGSQVSKSMNYPDVVVLKLMGSRLQLEFMWMPQVLEDTGIGVKWMELAAQGADILTKGLPEGPVQTVRRLMMSWQLKDGCLQN